MVWTTLPTPLIVAPLTNNLEAGSPKVAKNSQGKDPIDLTRQQVTLEVLMAGKKKPKLIKVNNSVSLIGRSRDAEIFIDDA